MNTNDIKFLPIEIIDDTLSIKEPYLGEILCYLNKNKLEFTYIEARIVIPTLKTNESSLDKIIQIVKSQRAIEVQKAIKKTYL